MDRDLIKSNPATGKSAKKLKTGTYAPWSSEQIDAFREVAPDRLVFAMDIALCTGQRLGDILSMTWAQIDDQFINLTQGKTGAVLSVPIHSNLALALEKHKKNRTSTHVVTTSSGKPYKISHFKHEWIKWTKKAKLSGVVFHGLRKTAAV